MMFGDIDVFELWSMRINPSDLYNIERSHNPQGGGGQRYIQIGARSVAPTLGFLRVRAKDLPYQLPVRCIGQPDAVDQIEFHVKSEDQGGASRMRIANQNRYSRHRCRAWSPSNGFPSLQPDQTTKDAQALFARIGGVHVFLVRDGEDGVWAGYTTGNQTPDSMRGFDFAPMLFEGLGGHWRFREDGA